MSSQKVMEKAGQILEQAGAEASGQLWKRLAWTGVLPNPSSRGCGQAPCVSEFRGLRPPEAGRGGRA